MEKGKKKRINAAEVQKCRSAYALKGWISKYRKASNQTSLASGN
jgi:hypothetical protein